MGPWPKRAGAADRLRWPHHRSGSECRPLLSQRGPFAGLRPSGDRAARGPQVAAAGRELSSILVGTISAIAGAVQCAGQSACDHLCAAGRWSAWPATECSSPQTSGHSVVTSQEDFEESFEENFEETHVHKKTLTAESNASDDFRIGCGSRRDGCCARNGVRF